jgi:hypothetical protein
MNVAILLQLAFLSFFLQSCTMDPSSVTLKRSSNNQLVDFKGSQSKKRRPMENMEYIKKAKKNIAEGNEDDDEEDDSDQDPYDLKNSYKEMYYKMLKKDKARKRAETQKQSKSKASIFDSYGQNKEPDTIVSKNIDVGSTQPSQQDLYKEIQYLKNKLDNLSSVNNSCNTQGVPKSTPSVKQNSNSSKIKASEIQSGGACVMKFENTAF